MKQRKVSAAAVRLFLVAVFISVNAISAYAETGIEALRQTSRAFNHVATKALPAVVSVQAETIVRTGSDSSGRYHSPFDDEFFDRFFGPRYHRRAPQEQRRVGQGSGFIISSDGYILTNNHVIEGADKIIVTLNDGREFENVEVIGTDPGSDVAVIKIAGEGLPTVELGDSDALQIGEWVIAVGNPFGLSETITVGVVSAKGRYVGLTEGDYAGERGYENFIQTDAAINPGNSGGPLLNIDGKVIGINSAIFSKSGGYMGIGFAIPINMAKSVKDQLIKSGKVVRGFIGISGQSVTNELSEFFDLENKQGAIVSEVMKDSPAEKGGLKTRDVILKINGKTVKNWGNFRNSIALMEPGTKINLTVLRNKKQLKIKVKIGSKDDILVAGGMTSEIGKELGIEVQDATKELERQFGHEGYSGVIVSKVTHASPAEKSGIKPGMLILNVNKYDISNTKEFNEALKETAKTKKALLLIKYNSYAWYTILSID